MKMSQKMGLRLRVTAFITVCNIPSNCHILLYSYLLHQEERENRK